MANGRRGVDAPSGPADAGAQDARPFVGRGHEIEELTAALGEAAAGRGGFFLVTGESGSGKTRLTEEAARLAESRGFAVLWGRCWEGGGAPAFWPWVQLLRQMLRDEDAPVGAAAALAALERPDADATRGPEPLDPERARFALFDLITGVVRALTDRFPVVIAIDDLHAADSDSMLLMRFLAREASRLRVLLVATYVDAPLAGAAERVLTAEEVVRDATHLPLRGLSQDETSLLVARLVLGGRAEPDQAIEEETKARVYEITEGNPLFVLEAIRLWRAEGRFDGAGRLRSDGLALPGRIRDLFRQRVQRLPVHEQRLLAGAAVLGRRFDLGLLERMMTGIVAREEVAAMLDGALRADLLRETRFLPKRYEFSHGVLQETLYAEIEFAERARLHRRAAVAVEDVFRGDLGAHLADIAHHLARAGQDGDIDAAIAYSARAAEQALRVRGYEDAVRLTDQALRLLDVGRVAGRGDAARRCPLLLAHADALQAAGHRARALAAYRDAATLARELGEAELLAEAALGCAGGWTGFLEVAKFDQPDREASGALQDQLRQAVDALGERQPALRARLLSRLAVERIHTASLTERDELTEEAVALARSVNQPALLAAVLCDRHVALWVPDTLYERLAATHEILGLAETAGDTTLKLMALAWHVGDALEAGEEAGLEGKLELFGRLARAQQQPAFTWGYEVHRAMRAMLRGRFERAAGLAKDAFRIGREATATALVVYGLQMRALWQLQGKDDLLSATEPSLRGAAELFPNLPSVRLELAQVCLQLGRVEEARVEWEKIAAHGFDDVPQDNNRLFCLAGLADVCAALDDGDRARRLYALMLPHAEQNVVSAFTAVCLGSAARCLGMLAHALGEMDDAESHFRLALQRNLALDAQPWVAWTRQRYAAMLAARGRPGDRRHAFDLASSALATARSLGMAPLLARAEALLPRLDGGAEAPPPAPVVVPEPPVLSENVFRQEGDLWTIRFDGRGCALRDVRGLRYLAELIRHPGRELHAAEIMRATHDTAPAIAPEVDATTQTSMDLGDAGEHLDGRAIVQYQRRLAELREELEEAERNNDLGRIDRAREELSFLTDELSRAGRGRRTASHAERARVTVTRGIKVALERIQAAHPALARHLQATVRRGYFCSYTPDPRHPIAWDL